MNYTKQDIQKLAAALGRIGVKDTQFSVLGNPTTDTKFTVVHQGKNYTVTADTLLRFVQNDIDLNSISVIDKDGESTNLYDWIQTIETQAFSKTTGDGTALIDTNVSCNHTIGGNSYKTVSDVIDMLFSVLSGISDFPNTASIGAINNIITDN